MQTLYNKFQIYTRQKKTDPKTTCTLYNYARIKYTAPNVLNAPMVTLTLKYNNIIKTYFEQKKTQLTKKSSNSQW